MSKFYLASSVPILKTSLFDVTHDRAVGPKDIVIDRKIVRHPGASAILAVDDIDRVLLIRQYRLPPRKQLWELPAGRIDPGETPLQTAKRELQEETGYQASNWTNLCRFWTAPGFCSERISVFVARKIKSGDASPEPYESIEPRWVGISEALAMIADGHIEDAKTMVALLYAAHSTRQFSKETNL
jgi:ADP-ribose pyrophosphatase